MTQTAKYSAVLAKIGAERSKLLNETRVKTLAESKNLQEFNAQLRDSSYQGEIGKQSPPLTGRKLESAFEESFINTAFKIIKNSPLQAVEYLRLYLKRFEIDDIKTLVKPANIKLSTEDKLSKIYLSAEEYLKNRGLIEEAAKMQTMRQAINVFKGTDYALPLNMGLQSYEEDGLTVCLDILMDKVYYEKLYDAYNALPRNEQPHANYYASHQNDSFTLLTTLRGKALGYDPDWLRLAVPKRNFNLPNETVEAMITSPDFESALKVAQSTSYRGFFARAQTQQETISASKKEFDRAMLVHAKISKVPEAFNIGAPIAFLTQKQVEVSNLVAISAGVEAEVAPEDIHRQLLL